MRGEDGGFGMGELGEAGWGVRGWCRLHWVGELYRNGYVVQ